MQNGYGYAKKKWAKKFTARAREWKELLEVCGDLIMPSVSWCQRTRQIASLAAADHLVSLDEPTPGDVAAAIRKLQNGRAFGISAELLNFVIPPVARAFHSISIPSSCLSGGLVTCHPTGKMALGLLLLCTMVKPHDRMEQVPTNYIFSVPGKVFAHVLVVRIQPLLDRTHRPHQSGFTASRSTVDAILAVRLLSKLRRPSTVYVAYLDIKAAGWRALWKAPGVYPATP